MTINVVERIDDRVPVRHVLASVSDKAGLERFIPGLIEASPKVKIFSTGGTYAAIEKILGRDAKKRLVQVSDYTGQPEMRGGLVKTLDFKIYLGLLSETYNDAHAADLKRVGGVTFDMVVVNLYPFRETIAKPDTSVEVARANIDIGGPCMVRAAAKNFIRVAPVVDPADYGRILKDLVKGNGCTTLRLRFDLARKAFAHTAEYDTAIAKYLAEREFSSVQGLYRV